MSAKSGKSKKSAKSAKPPKEMKDLVHKKDRLTYLEVIAYLIDLKEADARVKDPLKNIEEIFDKIQKWKEAFGDQEKQAAAVTHALKQAPEDRLDVHNVRTLATKLQTLQQAIGLSDDEMYIIIYSSIDHDNLNNLIVHAGEFLMWFNLNFEGESREEIDFRESK